MMNQEVTTFIEELKEPWHAAYCRQLRELVHRTLPDVQERIQYRKPHFLKNGKYAAVISTAKEAVSFTIFNATGVDMPEGFEGPPERKTVKFRQGQPVDEKLLEDLLGRASASL